MAIFITVFAGRANSDDLRLLQNNRPAGLATVTRATLAIGSDIFIDSDVYPEALVWNTATEGADKGIFTIALGGILTAYLASTPAYLTLYDPGTPGGLIWEDDCDNPEIYVEVCTAGAAH